MDPSRGGDSRYNLNYSMGGIGLSLADQADLYGNPAGSLGTGGGSGGGRPPSGGLIQTGSAGQCQSMGGGGGGGGGQSRGIKRTSSDCYDDHHRGSGGSMTSQTLQGLESCGAGNGSGGGGGQSGGNVPDVVDDSYSSMQNKKSPPANGKKTKGRVKIKMEYIDNKLRRYTTFSKRKTGIMKKAYELSTLTGTQVMLLVASETGHVYTFATRKLQPMITSEAGKQLIQTCLNSPDPPSGGGGGDQRMSATGFEETELSYNIADEDSKDDRSPLSSGNESDDSSDMDSPRPSSIPNSQNILQPDSPSSVMDLHNQQHHQHFIHHQQSTNSVHYNVMKMSPLTQLSGVGGAGGASVNGATGGGGNSSITYPASALSNLPQEVLLGLVQSGHLQLHSEDDSGGSGGGGGHQYITIPFSMATGGNSSTTSSSSTGNNNTRGGGGGGGGGGQSSEKIKSTTSTASSSGNRNKIRVRDLSTRHSSSSTGPSIISSSSPSGTINGRQSPFSPNDASIHIKTEIIEEEENKNIFI